jgi:hypothetical protein
LKCKAQKRKKADHLGAENFKKGVYSRCAYRLIMSSMRTHTSGEIALLLEQMGDGSKSQGIHQLIEPRPTGEHRNAAVLKK